MPYGTCVRVRSKATKCDAGTLSRPKPPRHATAAIEDPDWTHGGRMDGA
jgi:hypothetical protein